MSALRWIALVAFVLAAAAAEWGRVPVEWNVLLCIGLAALSAEGIQRR